MRAALDLAECVAVMGRGHIVFAGTPRELQKVQSVRAQWLGIQTMSRWQLKVRAGGSNDYAAFWC